LESAYKIALSREQEVQIEEIFNLFDTDGGGSIDRKELDFAMMALGFQSKKSKKKASNKAAAAMDAIMADGSVTLEEFSALMMGELSGKDPKESLRAVFALLSRSDGVSEFDGYITLDKLQSICTEIQVLESVSSLNHLQEKSHPESRLTSVKAGSSGYE
jgi:Ca2+-binding EF-hand superfamily protein